MARLVVYLMCLAGVCRAEASSGRPEKPTVIVVAGAAGEEQFGKAFQESAEIWKATAKKAEATFVGIGLTNKSEEIEDRQKFIDALAAEPKEGTEFLWLILLGHGTFDGKEAKFNLTGPDFSSDELATWLKPFKRPVIIANTASGSAPFLTKLSGPERVIISATRSGHEVNYTRFGRYFSEAFATTEADLDKDGQVSVLEGFLAGSRKTLEFYESEGRLATEHALLDDNGDGLGTPADWFRGIRAVKKTEDKAGLDGFRAHQAHLIRSESEQKLSPEVRAKRDAVELKIAKLRENKASMNEESYYGALESLLLELARIYGTSD